MPAILQTTPALLGASFILVDSDPNNCTVVSYCGGEGGLRAQGLGHYILQQCKNYLGLNNVAYKNKDLVFILCANISLSYLCPSKQKRGF